MNELKSNLTPKQKAAQLIDMFKSITGHAGNYDKQFAIECAKKMVDEINVNVLLGIDLASTWGNYWEEVKKEIENFKDFDTKSFDLNLRTSNKRRKMINFVKWITENYEFKEMIIPYEVVDEYESRKTKTAKNPI